MNENQEVLSGLKTAMEAELTGYNFYKNASENVKDSKAKQALSEMAQEELAHFKYLRYQYKSVLEKGHYDFSKSLVKKAEGQEENPIFSNAIKERIKDSHFEVSVLTIGMKLEMDAVDFYRSCAEKSGSPEAKKFFNELADWEQLHLNAFKHELDSLKEDYWTANDFVPM